VAVRRRPARRAPGQHFLRSSRLARDLVSDANLRDAELVVDLGAGTGVLTHALAEHGARVVAVEMDPALTAQLRQRFANTKRVTVVEADVRRFGWPEESFSVVANLPFSGSGAMLDHLLHDPAVPLRVAHVIVQWELAAKHAAVWPATARGTYWKAWYELSISRRLSRSAFSPVPSVDAAVLRIERRRVPYVAPEAHDRYHRFLTEAFAARAPLARGLRRRLTSVQLRRQADVLGFSPAALPRDLDARQWACLFAFSRAHSLP